jgi:hypothetical protein
MSSGGANEWPLWVKVGLMPHTWRAPRSRRGPIIGLLCFIVLNLALVPIGLLWDLRFLWLAAPFALSNLWILLAIRWVDKQGKWPTAD